MQGRPHSNQGVAMTASSQHKILPYNPEYLGKNFGNRWALGPIYKNRKPFREDIKKDALDHVVDHSQSSLPQINTAIGTVEAEVRAMYAANVVSCLSKEQLIKLMALDGCIFLLMAFSILGASSGLKFSENHSVFGYGYVEYIEVWLDSMFYVGNQIPSIVLDKLMNLSLFKALRRKIKCDQHLDLERRTLHNFLTDDRCPKPVDLIHCLQSIMVGLDGGPKKAIAKKHNDAANIVSASMLSKWGIKFQKLRGESGIRGICYKRNIFSGVVYLPGLKVDKHTKRLFNCILKYEMAQAPHGDKSEASSYIKFLCELIHTPQDIHALESEGIIQGQSDILVGILRSLDVKVSNANMHPVSGEIVGNRPWRWQKVLKWLVVICTILGLLFAAMQMNYGIIAYYKPRKS